MFPEQTYTFTAKLWLYQGKGAWHFITVPKDIATQLRFFVAESVQSTWGSLRVTATICDTHWETSLFPDKKSGSYLLPVKAAIRKKERLQTDDNITVTVRIS